MPAHPDSQPFPREISLRSARQRRRMSLRSAAKRLGVTHVYLSALEHGRKALSVKRAEELRKLYEVADDEVMVQPGTQLQTGSEFISWLCEQVSVWDSRFILPTVPAVRRRTRDIFVEPLFYSAEGCLGQNEILERLFLDSEERALLLSGSIGSGKSFFLRMLTVLLEDPLVLRQRQLRFIPILVSCGKLSLRPGTLVGSLVDYFRSAGYDGSSLALEDFLRDAINQGRVLIMFDGLDEIQDQNIRASCFAHLQRIFVEQIRPTGSKMIISSREAAFLDGQWAYGCFWQVRLGAWSAVQVYQALELWSWRDRTECARLWALLRSNLLIFELAQLPLMFHLLTTLYGGGGSGIFQELAALCDACCEVLEESWSSARGILPGAPLQGEDPMEEELPSWVKWRHFLIHLMQGVLSECRSTGASPRYVFSRSELEESWRDFLIAKGVENTSLDFSRLVGIFSDQNQIGPIFQTRSHITNQDGSSLVEEYKFLQPVFGYYYLAKALINDPGELEGFCLHHMRHKEWEIVVPLVLQELGRSERTSENRLGQRLLEAVVASDARGIPPVGVGHFGLFTAMRAMASYNVQRHWESVVKPVLEIAMNSHFAYDSMAAFWRMGEYGSVACIRDYIADRHAELHSSALPEFRRDDLEWRVLFARFVIGEGTDRVLPEMFRMIERLMDPKIWHKPEKRLYARRSVAVLFDVGRLFTVGENGAQLRNHCGPLREQLHDIHEVLMAFVGFIQTNLEAGIAARCFKNYFFWDVLVRVIAGQARLGDQKEISQTLNSICGIIIRHHDVMFDLYPWRSQMLQFLKAAYRYAYLLERTIAEDLVSKLMLHVPAFTREEQQEAGLICTLAGLRGSAAQLDSQDSELCDKLWGEVDSSRMTTWLNVVARSAKVFNPNYLELADALCGLQRYSARLPELLSRIEPAALSLLLEGVLQQELGLALPLREQERYYVLPGSSYGKPLYDHAYNCMVEIARLQNPMAIGRQEGSD